MEQYVCRNLCENFRQIGQKMKKLWLIQVEWLGDVVRLSQADGRQGRVGGEIMVQCTEFYFSKLSNAIVTKCLSCNMHRKRVCLASRPQ